MRSISPINLLSRQSLISGRAAALLLAALLTLAACETPPKKPEQPAGPSGYAMEQVPVLLEKAAGASSDERPQLLLEAVEILLANGEVDWARNIIAGMSAQTLTGATYGRHQLLSSQLAVASGSQFAALAYLTEARLENLLPGFMPELATALHEQRAQLFANVGDYRASVRERVLLDDVLVKAREMEAREMEARETPEERRNLNHDLLWQTLMQLSASELQTLQSEADNRTLAGWYSLASLSKDNQANLNRQLAMVDQWAREWPEHPASLRLPADLQLLRDLVDNQPQRVALLLPLTGPLEQASEAIRDGFMAAFYSGLESGDPIPDLRIYDTGTQDVSSAYDQAVLDGAQTIIGPLEKESIAELALRLQLPVPTLALNYAETPHADQQQLYQFGLAVEDEARQVAQQAWQDGHRRALIFAPNSQWGDRSVDAFWQEWQALGGEVTRDYRFAGNDDYLGVIAEALHITKSKERARDLRRMLGRGLEFEPRRRQDVDMIFLVANSEQARQIKPTLAFHYAGNVPVYATSQVYSSDDSKANQDMNGIRFTSLPWFFVDSAPEYQTLQEHANTSAAYQRLYALGVDAFHLYPRLRQLREVTNARYYGYTGALSLNAEGKIQRQQTWAQFVRGRAQIMPTLAEDNG